MPRQNRRPRVYIGSCCLASALNIAIFAIGCPANAASVQSVPAAVKDLPGHGGRQGLQLAQASAEAFSIEDIAGLSGQTIPVLISIADATVQSGGFIMLRGVPGEFTLTKGFKTGNSWLISLAQLEDLGLVVPDDFQGTFDLDVTLVSGDRKQKHAQKISVNIGPKPNARGQKTAVQPPKLNTRATLEPAAKTAPEKVQPSPAAQSAISPELEKSMMDRAAQLIQSGDVASARLLYEHLASNASALGALSLAKTYDPEVLSALDVIGMQPDIALAQRWYKRAAELGDEKAARRLEAFAATGR